MFACEIKEQPVTYTLSVRFRAPVQELPQHFSKAYGTICQYMTEHGLTSPGPAYAAYHNMDMSNLDVEAGFRMLEPATGSDTIHSGQFSGGTYAICHYTGAYGGLGAVYQSLMEYAAQQGFAPSGMAIEWYLNGPDEVSSPEELQTDIAFPVMRIDAPAHQAL